MIEIRYTDTPGQVHLVSGQVEQMMRWLVANEKRMMLPERMQITFHCVNERMTRVEIRQFEGLDRNSESC